jgi:hypothetical protein
VDQQGVHILWVLKHTDIFSVENNMMYLGQEDQWYFKWLLRKKDKVLVQHVCSETVVPARLVTCLGDIVALI